jgi:AcrR family transcriptional regulator
MPKLVDHEGFRVELLDRSFAWIAARGLQAVTMRGLAKELGVSTGVLYHYFRDQDEFLTALLAHLTEADIARGVEALPPGSSRERAEALIAFLRSQESYFQKMVSLLFDSLRFPKRPRKGRGPREIFLQFLRQYKRVLKRELALTDTQTDTCVSIVVGTIAQRMLSPDEANFNSLLGVLS